MSLKNEIHKEILNDAFISLDLDKSARNILRLRPDDCARVLAELGGWPAAERPLRALQDAAKAVA